MIEGTDKGEPTRVLTYPTATKKIRKKKLLLIPVRKDSQEALQKEKFHSNWKGFQRLERKRK